MRTTYTKSSGEGRNELANGPPVRWGADTGGQVQVGSAEWFCRVGWDATLKIRGGGVINLLLIPINSKR